MFEVVYVKEVFVLVVYEIVVDGFVEGGYYCFVLDLLKSGDKLILVCDWGCLVMFWLILFCCEKCLNIIV